MPRKRGRRELLGRIGGALSCRGLNASARSNRVTLGAISSKLGLGGQFVSFDPESWS